jgi:hypothetical protein
VYLPTPRTLACRRFDLQFPQLCVRGNRRQEEMVGERCDVRMNSREGYDTERRTLWGRTFQRRCLRLMITLNRPGKESEANTVCSAKCGYSSSVLALSLRIEPAVLASTSTASQYDSLLSRPRGLKASSFKTFATIAWSPYMEFLLPLLLTSPSISPLHAVTTCAHVSYSLRIL